MQLERDAGTRIAYGMVATYAFFLYFLGPVTPLIAEQLGVSLTLAGLTGVALAAGLVLSGLVGPSLIRRWGRRAVALSAATSGIGALIPLLDFGTELDSNCRALLSEAKSDAGIKTSDMAPRKRK